MATGDTFGWYSYNSDDGSIYTLKMSTAEATAGGFSAGSSPLNATSFVWPWHTRDIRHVNGVSSAGKRNSLKIADASSTMFQNGGTYTLHSVVYTILGAEGERRPASHVR